MANPVLYCVDDFYATVEITRDLLDRPATHRSFSGGRMTSAILAWERSMGVVRDATHGTPQVSSQHRYPFLGVPEGIRVPLPRHPPLTRKGNGGSVTITY